MKHRAFSRGFTLIELMVVVVIMVTLATLTMIAIFNARKEARDHTRITVAEQLSLAVRLYKEATGDYPQYSDGVEIGVGGAIDALIAPYLPSGIQKDPLEASDASTYGYYYYSNYECGGVTEHVIMIKHMENADNGNYEEMCNGAGSLKGPHLGGPIPIAHAQTEASYYSQGSYYTQASYYTQSSYYTQGSYYSQASYYTQGAYGWIDSLPDQSDVYIIFIN